MGGLRFSRLAIIDAYCTFALVNGAADAADALGAVAWLARIANVRDLSDVRLSSYRGRRPSMTSQIEAIDGLEESTREHYFTLCTKLLGEDKSEEIQEAYRRVHAINGVTISLDNDGDDPLRITFSMKDSIAPAWADAHGALEGGSWESDGGDEGFLYDLGEWRPGLIRELLKEGYDLDLSSFSEPGDEQIRIAQHSHECEECDHDYSEAARHVETLDAHDRPATEAEQTARDTLSAFAVALHAISYADSWMLPTLFHPSIVWHESPQAFLSV
jgi:hypothetical protein